MCRVQKVQLQNLFHGAEGLADLPNLVPSIQNLTLSPQLGLSEYSEPSYELSDFYSEASELHSKTSGPTSRASELSSEPDQE